MVEGLQRAGLTVKVRNSVPEASGSRGMIRLTTLKRPFSENHDSGAYSRSSETTCIFGSGRGVADCSIPLMSWECPLLIAASSLRLYDCQDCGLDLGR